MSLFNECVQSCMNFKVITCNYSYGGGISLSYDIIQLPSIELSIMISLELKKCPLSFFVECSIIIGKILGAGERYRLLSPLQGLRGGGMGTVR